MGCAVKGDTMSGHARIRKPKKEKQVVEVAPMVNEVEEVTVVVVEEAQVLEVVVEQAQVLEVVVEKAQVLEVLVEQAQVLEVVVVVEEWLIMDRPSVFCLIQMVDLIIMVYYLFIQFLAFIDLLYLHMYLFMCCANNCFFCRHGFIRFQDEAGVRGPRGHAEDVDGGQVREGEGEGCANTTMLVW